MKDHERIWHENLRDERDAAALYEGLAALDARSDRARSLALLARSEREHAAFWEKKLRAAGVAVTPWFASSRVRAALWLARRVGVGAILPLVALGEEAEAKRYLSQADALPLVQEEEAHRETLAQLGKREAPTAATKEGQRRSAAGTVRAAVFGANDGVVSNLALVMGVAASGADHATVLLSGVAGLFAGAFSMATGEYVSVSSQRDLLRRKVLLETRTLGGRDAETAATLEDVLVGRGLPRSRAQELAREALAHPEAALDLFVREELGLDPGEMGSPFAAALSSFFTFALGAVLPLAPLLFGGGVATLVASVAISSGFLAGVGALLGFLSGTGLVRSAVRMLGLAALSTAVTVAVGRLFHVSVG